MMPYEHFLELRITEFKLIKELTQICHDRILSVLDVVASCGTKTFLKSSPRGIKDT